MRTQTPFETLEKSAFTNLISKGLGTAGRMIANNPVKSLTGGVVGYGAGSSAPGQNFMDSMVGKVNAARTDALKGLAASGAAVGAGARAVFGNGSWNDIGQAANNKWNQYEQYAGQQRDRADQGWNKGTGYLQGAGNRVAKPFAMLGAGVQGLSEGGYTGMAEALNNQSRASNGMIEANDKQVATGQQQSWNPAATGVANKPAPAATPPAPNAPPKSLPPVGGTLLSPNAAQPSPAASAPLNQTFNAPPKSLPPVGGSLLSPATKKAPTFTPSNDFLSKVMGSYNPTAKVDQTKADVIRRLYQQNSGQLTPNQVYANPEYRTLDNSLRARSKSAHTTPFSALTNTDLQKEALANGIARGLGLVGRKLTQSGAAAKQMAREAAPIIGGAQNEILDMRNLTAAAKGVGNKRLGIAGRLDDAAKAIGESPNLQKAINYGGGTALAGAGLYGSNRMGYNSGVDNGIAAGLGEGLDTGMRAGVESAFASQSANQPGYLQNLWSGVLGRPSGGMNAGVAYGDLSNRRSDILNLLMRSYAG